MHLYTIGNLGTINPINTFIKLKIFEAQDKSLAGQIRARLSECV